MHINALIWPQIISDDGLKLICLEARTAFFNFNWMATLIPKPVRNVQTLYFF